MPDKGMIHHKNGDVLNNQPSNWQVLCPLCHGEKHPPFQGKRNKSGISINVSFAPWRRKEIFEAVGYKCQECGDEVVDYSQHRKDLQYRCQWCKNIVPKDAIVKWQSGEIMCRVCFDKWLKLKSPSPT